jgi:hypothetical protein
MRKLASQLGSTDELDVRGSLDIALAFNLLDKFCHLYPMDSFTCTHIYCLWYKQSKYLHKDVVTVGIQAHTR